MHARQQSVSQSVKTTKEHSNSVESLCAEVSCVSDCDLRALPFRMPVDRIAPILDMVFWCLSVMTERYLSLQRL